MRPMTLPFCERSWTVASVGLTCKALRWSISRHTGRALLLYMWRKNQSAAPQSGKCSFGGGNCCTVNQESPSMVSFDVTFWSVWGSDLCCAKIWILSGDSQLLHRESLTLVSFMTNNILLFLHPLYSLDLVSADFYLFPKIKMQFIGHSFEPVV